jgi:hypothetical protein
MKDATQLRGDPEPEENLRDYPRDAGRLLKEIFGGSWMTQAVAVAAELGIADLLECMRA